MSDSKVILISGANRGIGLHIAKRLQQEGYRLSLGVRDPQTFNVETPSDQLAVFNYDATIKDPSEKASANQWIANTIARFGAIDGVINCAGILRKFHIEDDDESVLDEMWDVNVKGPMRVIKAALPHLRKSGSGRVINLVSMSGKRVKGLASGYAITKHAQMALHNSIRNIGWEDGIRCTAVCPSWVNTDMADASGIPPIEMTQPQDVAECIATVLKLPNSAAINEIGINCNLEYG